MQKKMSLGLRLRLWRKSFRLKSYELARKIKISQSFLSDIENDKSLPSANTLAKLHFNTSVNIAWLLTGKGAMTRPDDLNKQGKGPTLLEPAPYYQDDDELMDLIGALVRIYRKFPQKRKHLEEMIDEADPDKPSQVLFEN